MEHGHDLPGLIRVAVAFALTACGPTPSLTCEEADVALSDEVTSRFVSSTSCLADDECALVSRDLQCPDDGASFSTSPVRAVHVDDRAAWESAIVAAGEVVCPEAPRDCTASGDGPALEARCAGFACIGVDPTSSCVAACEALGCPGHPDNCAVLCAGSATAACVASATSCPRLNGCVMFDVAGVRRLDGTCTEPVRYVPLPTRLEGISGDYTCGIAPDGDVYVVGSGSYRSALGWAPCTDEDALTAGPCP